MQAEAAPEARLDVVAVSHYYHLARIKLTAHRMGIACATSPCAMSRRLAKEPYFVARECAAFVSYYRELLFLPCPTVIRDRKTRPPPSASEAGKSGRPSPRWRSGSPEDGSGSR